MCGIVGSNATWGIDTGLGLFLGGGALRWGDSSPMESCQICSKKTAQPRTQESSDVTDTCSSTLRYIA